MSLPPEHQLKELLEKSSAILILVPESADGDAFGAASGLGNFLESDDKVVTIGGSDIAQIAERFSFLPLPKTVVSSISGVREFILSFNTERNNIVSIRTERGPSEYNIFITPEKGSIDPRDFSFVPAKFSFDLVIVIGAPDKDSLGALAEENPDIFYEVPVVNIDFHPANDRFGQINLVEVTASSSSEIVANLLEKLEPKLVTERVASPLLAGIVSATESFQKKNTTPSVLHVASRLMDRGANQHDIIFRLVKTQPLATLKLWGRVMAGLKWDESRKLMWASVSPKDIIESHSHIDDLPVILEKIRTHSSVGTFFAILSPKSATETMVIMKNHGSGALESIRSAFPDSKLRGDTLTATLPAATPDEAEAILLRNIPKRSSAGTNL